MSKVIELISRGRRILTHRCPTLKTTIFAAHQATSKGTQNRVERDRRKGGGREVCRKAATTQQGTPSCLTLGNCFQGWLSFAEEK